MLIRVTSFFRDPQVFEALEALEAGVLPQLSQGRAYDDPIRIWVPGCASGEEAYSLAIVLLETSSPPTSAARSATSSPRSTSTISKRRCGMCSPPCTSAIVW
ncbi:MAG: CheR family methyltransferase [Polyangiaceae bacterium]